MKRTEKGFPSSGLDGENNWFITSTPFFRLGRHTEGAAAADRQVVVHREHGGDHMQPRLYVHQSCTLPLTLPPRTLQPPLGVLWPCSGHRRPLPWQLHLRNPPSRTWSSRCQRRIISAEAACWRRGIAGLLTPSWRSCRSAPAASPPRASSTTYTLTPRS